MIHTETKIPAGPESQARIGTLHFSTAYRDRLLDPLLNLLFPEICFICGTPVSRRSDCSVCPQCLENARSLKIQPPFCPSCGLPLHNFGPGSESLCLDCILNPPPYSGARSFGFYGGNLAKLIHGFKFLGRRNLTELLAPLLLETFRENWNSKAFDLILPVPLHRRRKRERGYNQSELLARELARGTGIPIERSLLARIRPTLSQVGLKDDQRRNNVRKAFRCRHPEKISGRRVLLVDDVMTTGATAGSASGAILEAGALRVSVLALARTE